MDSDDIMMPDRMERQIGFMKENPKAVLCGANMRLFSIDSTNTKRVVNSTSHPYTMSWETLYHSKTPWYMNNPTLCYKKSAILSVGGYRTDDPRILYLSEDYDLLTRVLKKYGSVYCMPDILLMYRLHPGQLTHRLNENSAEHIQLLQDCIENANK
jgi:hypothetical protein